MPTTFGPFVLWLLLMASVLALVAWQSNPDERGCVVRWAVAGTVVCLVKIALFQQAPQWHDIPLDSLKYQLNAEAFHLHWLGLPVDPVALRLDGYAAGWNATLGPLWQPDAPLSYASALGTYEWLYSAFLGTWSFVGDDWVAWAISSNAIMGGVFPAAAFVLARSMGAPRSAAQLAAILSLLDPSTGVNAAWLLKDTMAGFLAIVGCMAAVRLRDHAHWSGVIVMGMTIGLLGGVRFVAYLALATALLSMAVALLKQQQRREAVAIVLGLLVSGAIFVGLYIAPRPPNASSLAVAVVQPLVAKSQTLRAGIGNPGADESVIKWHARWRDNPLAASLTSVAHTLFAPYPWVMLTHGINGTNHTELYYPGTIFWILCLPLIAYGCIAAARERSTAGIGLLVLLSALWLAYTVFLGEWSTRQRVFMMPIFLAFAAVGWDALRHRWRRTSPTTM